MENCTASSTHRSSILKPLPTPTQTHAHPTPPPNSTPNQTQTKSTLTANPTLNPNPPTPTPTPTPQITIFQRVLMAKPGVNVYDIRKECVGPLCYDFSDADAYLNSNGAAAAAAAAARRLAAVAGRPVVWTWRGWGGCARCGCPSFCCIATHPPCNPPTHLTLQPTHSPTLQPTNPPTPTNPPPTSGVRKALGVGNREWEECNMLVHASFWGES